MLIKPDHNTKWNITYTSPMNHRQDRCWNPDRETNYPLGFKKPVKSTTRMTRNLFHMVSFERTGLLSEIVGLGKRSRERNVEIRIQGTPICIYI